MGRASVIGARVRRANNERTSYIVRPNNSHVCTQYFICDEFAVNKN